LKKIKKINLLFVSGVCGPADGSGRGAGGRRQPQRYRAQDAAHRTLRPQE